LGPITAIPKPFSSSGVPLSLTKVLNKPSVTTTLQICNSPTRKPRPSEGLGKRKTNPWFCSLRLKNHNNTKQICFYQTKYRKIFAKIVKISAFLQIYPPMAEILVFSCLPRHS
jgi:hypothetical protein